MHQSTPYLLDKREPDIGIKASVLLSHTSYQTGLSISIFPMEINQRYRLHQMALICEKHHTLPLLLCLFRYRELFAVYIIHQ